MTRREKRLEKLKNRQETKETTNKRYGYNIPKDVPVYKVREGQNLIDIIPYKVSNPLNPAIRVNDFEIGDEDYYQLLHTHRGIGTNNNEYLCKSKMFGKPCPICEAQKGLWDVDKASAKALYPTDHVVYNVIDLLEPEKGIQVWKVSKFWVEDNLQKLSAMKSRSGEPIIYGDWELGWSIEFYGSEQKFQKTTYFKPENFSFVKREKQYTEDIVDKAYPIDTYYNMVDYDVIYNDYNGIDEPVKETKVEPKKSLDEYKEAIRKAYLNDDNGELDLLLKEMNNDDFDDLFDEVQKEEDEKKEKELKRQAEKAKAEEVQRTPRRRARANQEVKKCPFGYAWGECDKHPECEKQCSDEDYNKCYDVQDGILDVKDI